MTIDLNERLDTLARLATDDLHLADPRSTVQPVRRRARRSAWMLGTGVAVAGALATIVIVVGSRPETAEVNTTPAGPAPVTQAPIDRVRASVDLTLAEQRFSVAVESPPEEGSEATSTLSRVDGDLEMTSEAGVEGGYAVVTRGNEQWLFDPPTGQWTHSVNEAEQEGRPNGVRPFLGRFRSALDCGSASTLDDGTIHFDETGCEEERASLGRARSTGIDVRLDSAGRLAELEFTWVAMADDGTAGAEVPPGGIRYLTRWRFDYGSPVAVTVPPTDDVVGGPGEIAGTSVLVEGLQPTTSTAG